MVKNIKGLKVDIRPKARQYLNGGSSSTIAYIVELINNLKKKYPDILMDTVVFTEGSRQCYRQTVWDRKTMEPEHRIVFGCGTLEGWMMRGFREYKTLEHLLDGEKPTGREALRRLVAHEFTHAVQDYKGYERFPSGKRDLHGAQFVREYRHVELATRKVNGWALASAKVTSQALDDTPTGDITRSEKSKAAYRERVASILRLTNYIEWNGRGPMPPLEVNRVNYKRVTGEYRECTVSKQKLTSVYAEVELGSYGDGLLETVVVSKGIAKKYLDPVWTYAY